MADQTIVIYAEREQFVFRDQEIDVILEFGAEASSSTRA